MSNTSTSSISNTDLHRVRGRLRIIRRAGRALLMIRQVSWLLSVGIMLIAGLVLLDFTARFPPEVRFALLGGLVAVAAFGYRQWFHPISRFRPPLVDIAHRFEQWMASQGHASASTLAAGVGLKVNTDDGPLTESLTRLATLNISGLLPRVPWGMLRWHRAAGALAGMTVLCGAVSVVFSVQPAFAITGITRLFMPWSDAAWPKLTAISDATPEGVHPADTALPLRALLSKSNKAPGGADITVRYRMIFEDGTKSSPTESVLVPQPGSRTRTTADSAGSGETRPADELYERLLETSTWTQLPKSNTTLDRTEAAERWLEYTFFSEDDRTATRRIRIVDPPILQVATATITPPAYAQPQQEEDPIARQTRWMQGKIDTSNSDASVGPILFGSAVRMELEYSKPVVPSDLDAPSDAVVTHQDNRITITTTPEESSGIMTSATDTDGLQTRDTYRARLAIVRDRPPTADIVDPSVDRAVLVTALVPIVGEATDDLRLDKVRIEYQLARPDPASLAQEPEPSGTPVVIARSDAELGSTATIQTMIDLKAIGANPGDEVWVRVIAQDLFDLNGTRHEPVRSSPRRIRVIEESQFIEMIQAELEGIRRNAMSIDRRQASVMQDAKEHAKQEELLPENQRDSALALGELATRQAEIAQRLRGQAAALDRLQARLDQNRADDDAIQELITDAGSAAREARQAADRAAGQASAKAAGQADTDPSAEQQEVRDALTRLIDGLDKGQDDWIVRRAIERLVESQRELQEQTEALGQQTSGRDIDELTTEDRTELEQIAERQRELARQAQSAIDNLAERAEQIRENDPTQATALEAAARGAAQQQLAEALEQAASQIGDNQTGEAGRLQEQSIQDLEAMLEQLENARRMRDQALRRELASLIQSIESLIRQQTAAIDALDGAIESAQSRIERVRTNTIAASANASEGFEEMTPIAELLNHAAESQLTAIRAIRAVPPSVEDARPAELDALAKLQEALAEARKQDESAAQREQERQRRELLDAYREALTAQTEIQRRTNAIDPTQLTRRDRATLRAIGRDQEATRIQIGGIPEQFEVPEGVISLFHQQIDLSLASAIRKLGRGDAGTEVDRGQSSAANLLRSIVEILSPQQNADNDEFEDQQAGGGGGGSGGAGGQEQPPIGQLEELRLLRSLQSLVLDQTRSAEADASEQLAEIQREIAEQARRIIESMQGGTPNATPDNEPEQAGPEQAETPQSDASNEERQR